jgi:hypothetical protein
MALCSSLMLAPGADIAVVSKLLGNASISITAGDRVGTAAADAVNGPDNLIAHMVLTLEDAST